MGATRTSLWLRCTTLVTLVCASTNSTAVAQARSAAALALEAELRLGRTVWVTDATGREEKAQIVNLSGGIVTMSAGDAVRRISAAQIARVRVRHTDSLINGALIGAGAAVAAGLFACTRMEPWENCRDDVGPITQIAAIGAGVGIGIDALIRGRKTVYEAPPPGVRVHVEPILARRRGGLRVSVGF